MTLVSGNSALIMRVASTPLQTGMLMSMSTTSGFAVRARSSACAPSEASPTTSMSSSSSRRARRPFLQRSWSSTSKILTGAMVVRLRCGKIDLHLCAATGTRLDLEPAAHGFYALLHDAHAEAMAVGPNERRIESLTVVLDVDVDLAVAAADADPGLVGVGVRAHVGEAFLDHADQLHLDFRRELQRFVLLSDKLNRDAGFG